MSKAHMIYIHPLAVRIWHWLHAAGIVLLVITGVQIRYPDIFGMFSFENAVTWHNWIGFIVIGDFFLWLCYYLATGKIKIYIPNFRTLIPGSIRQALFYGYGYFKGETNPHVMTPDNKFNPMQQNAYLMLMTVALPIQMLTGLLLWDVTLFKNFIDYFGGIRIIDTIHILLFFFFASFVCVHIYLSTLGHTVGAHLKAMISGWEEHH